LKRPNATVNVSLPVSTSSVGGAAFAGAFGAGSAFGFAADFSGAGDFPTAPFGWSFPPSTLPYHKILVFLFQFSQQILHGCLTNRHGHHS
jgi:hypothetical protein